MSQAEATDTPGPVIFLGDDCAPARFDSYATAHKTVRDEGWPLAGVIVSERVARAAPGLVAALKYVVAEQTSGLEYTSTERAMFDKARAALKAAGVET